MTVFTFHRLSLVSSFFLFTFALKKVVPKTGAPGRCQQKAVFDISLVLATPRFPILASAKLLTTRNVCECFRYFDRGIWKPITKTRPFDGYSGSCNPFFDVGFICFGFDYFPRVTASLVRTEKDIRVRFMPSTIL